MKLPRRSIFRGLGLGLLADLIARPIRALPRGKASKPSTTISVLFIGDSTTVGYGGTDPVPIFQADMLSDWGITVVATNQGINGTGTPSWVPGSTLTAAMAAGAALSPPATYAYIMLGINDSAVSAGPISPATYLSNMASTCAALVSNGYTVMIDQCLYVPDTVAGWNSASVTAMAGYIAGLPSLANGTTIRLNDQQAYAWAEANHGTTYFNANDVHPNAAGYAVMAGFWASAWPGTGPSTPATIRITVSAPRNKTVGAIFIGDDLTVGVGGTDPTAVFVSDQLSQYGITAVVSNQGLTGSKSADWLPAGSLLGPAKTAGAALSTPATFAFIMLGLNDSATANAVSSATYLSNITAIANNLVAAGYVVILNQPTFTPNGATNGTLSWNSTSVTNMAAYVAGLSALANGDTIRLGDQTLFAWSQANVGNSSVYNSNQVDPNTSGYTQIGLFWTQAFPGVINFSTAITGSLAANSFDLALSTAVSEGSYIQGAPFNINQAFYNIPITTALANAAPGLVVKWRPDVGSTRYEICLEMSQAIGSGLFCLSPYGCSLINGDGSTYGPMYYGNGQTIASNIMTVGNPNPQTAPTGTPETPSGHAIYQTVRMVSGTRPIVKTPSQLFATGAVPTYSNNGSATNTTWSTGSNFWPLSSCGLRFDGGTGGRPDLNLQPEWTAQYLAIQDSASLATMLLCAEVVGSVCCLLRDSNGQIFNINNFPNDNRQAGSLAASLTSTGTGQGWADLYVPSNTHHGEFCYVPYLLTGDSWYLERMQAYITQFLVDSQYNMPGAGNLLGVGGQVAGEERGFAWLLRDMACATLGTPASGLPSTMLPQSYFLSKLQNNYQYLLDCFVNGLTPEVKTFGLLWSTSPWSDEKGFGHCYRSEVINFMVWAGLYWQTILDFDATNWTVNVGNGTSGWAYDQPGATYGGYYHNSWCHGDQTPCTSWTDAWNTTAAVTLAAFTGTVTSAGAMTTSGLSGPLPGGSAMVMLASGLPLPIAQVSNGLVVLSGSGSSYTLVSGGGSLPGSTVGPEAMQAQQGFSGPWYIDGSNVIHYYWNGATSTPAESVSIYDTTMISLGSTPPQTTLVTGGGGGYNLLYAAVLRGQIAQGHSGALSPILSNALYSTGQFSSGFAVAYTFPGGVTPPTWPVATTDSFYVSAALTLSTSQVYPLVNGAITMITMGTSSVLELPGVNSTFPFQPVAPHLLRITTGGPYIMVSGSVGTIVTSDGQTFTMSSMTMTNSTPAITVSNTFGSISQPITHGSSVSVSGTAFGPSALTSISAVWQQYPGGTTTASFTSFAVSGGIWTATFTAPSSAGSYSLVVTGTGGNTATSLPSSVMTVV